MKLFGFRKSVLYFTKTKSTIPRIDFEITEKFPDGSRYIRLKWFYTTLELSMRNII